jgi:hypothetical protein
MKHEEKKDGNTEESKKIGGVEYSSGPEFDL